MIVGVNLEIRGCVAYLCVADLAVLSLLLDPFEFLGLELHDGGQVISVGLGIRVEGDGI